MLKQRGGQNLCWDLRVVNKKTSSKKCKLPENLPQLEFGRPGSWIGIAVMSRMDPKSGSSSVRLGSLPVKLGSLPGYLQGVFMHFQVPSGLADWITIIDFQCNFGPLDLSLTNILPKEMAAV